MENIAWNKFVKKIYINAPARDIYPLWATKKGISSWFLKDAAYMAGHEERASEAFTQKGDNFTWYWHNCDASEKGVVYEANGKDYLEISFANSKVAIHIEEKEFATLLTLSQWDIPTDEKSTYQIFYGCSNGWTFWLANLKAFVEHSITLHETKLHHTEPGYNGYEFINM